MKPLGRPESALPCWSMTTSQKHRYLVQRKCNTSAHWKSCVLLWLFQPARFQSRGEIWRDLRGVTAPVLFFFDGAALRVGFLKLTIVSGARWSERRWNIDPRVGTTPLRQSSLLAVRHHLRSRLVHLHLRAHLLNLRGLFPHLRHESFHSFLLLRDGGL